MNFPPNAAHRSAVCAVLLTAMLCQLPSCGFIVFNDPNADTAPPVTSEPPATEETTVITTEPPVETEAPPSPGELARERLDALPDFDLSSSAIMIATVDESTICPIEAEDAVVASRADSKRAVEEKFNTVIIANVTDSASMLKGAKEAAAADMYYADLLAIPLSDVGSFYTAGVLANMSSLPFTDYTSDYYHENIISEAMAGNDLTAVSGAANYNPEYLSCVYFNRTLAGQCGIEDLYGLVRDGKWTWDKLGEYAKLAAGSINGVYGHGSSEEAVGYIDLAAAAQGMDYITNTKGTVPAVDYLSDDSTTARAKAVVDTMYQLLYSDGSYAKSAKDEARSLFTSGSMLFHTDRLYYMTWLADNATEWGILPLPKYDESQSEYLSMLSTDAPVFCALENTPSYTNSGLALEALNAASYEYVLDTFISERTNYCLRDSDSISMLDIICGSVTTDFSHMFASGITNLANATYNAVSSAVTTRSTLDALYRSYQSSANRALTSAVKIYG